jgi:hypothetical protein
MVLLRHLLDCGFHTLWKPVRQLSKQLGRPPATLYTGLPVGWAQRWQSGPAFSF